MSDVPPSPAAAEEFLFALPIQSDKRLFYAPLYGLVALVNQALLDDRNTLFSALAGRRPALLPFHAQGPLSPDFLGLITTRDCNMSCRYCGFNTQAQTAFHMSERIARTAIRWMAESVCRQNAETLEVHFFGGEPFSAPEIMRFAVQFARLEAERNGLETRFEASTNGCLDDEMLSLATDFFQTIVLSIDGPADVHNRVRPLKHGGRSHSWVMRSARRLQSSPVELCTRTCVTKASVDALPKICDWLCRELSPAILCFEPLQETAESKAAGLLAPSPLEFSLAFAEASKVANAFNARAVYTAADPDSLRHTFCPVGRDTLIVAPDGTASACYLPPATWQARGLDLAYGQVKTNAVAMDPDAVDRIRRLTLLPLRCKRCFARLNCAGGCHVTNTYPGSDDSRSDFCTQTRLILVWNLLRKLGGNSLADSFLNDPKARNSVNAFPDDRILLQQHVK